MEGVAAGNPAHRHPPAAPPAVALDGLIPVLGAGGGEAAPGNQAEDGTQRHAIGADERERRCRHDSHPFAHNISISWRSRENSASTARARATITTSRPPSARLNSGRTSSRRRRLILFRTTALPSFRLTARPTRGRPSSLSLTNRARYPEAARRPDRRVRSKSAERSSRDRRSTRPGDAGLPVAPAGGGRQAATALETAGLDHLDAARGRHPGAEAMDLDSLALLRLMGTLHSDP